LYVLDNDDHQGHYKKSGSSNKKYHKDEGENSKKSHREEGKSSKHTSRYGSDHKKASEEKDDGYVKKAGLKIKKSDYEKFSNKNGKQNYHVAIHH
jgi:hypothetical protein